MGSKKTQTTNEVKHGTVASQINDPMLKDTFKQYLGQVQGFMGRDPYSMVAGASPLQQTAFRGGLGLGGPGGWRSALGGGLQGLGAGLMQQQDASPPQQAPASPLALIQRQDGQYRGAQPVQTATPQPMPQIAAQAVPTADPNQQYIDQLQQEIAKTYGNLNINPYR